MKSSQYRSHVRSGSSRRLKRRSSMPRCWRKLDVRLELTETEGSAVKTAFSSYTLSCFNVSINQRSQRNTKYSFSNYDFIHKKSCSNQPGPVWEPNFPLNLITAWIVPPSATMMSLGWSPAHRPATFWFQDDSPDHSTTAVPTVLS